LFESLEHVGAMIVRNGEDLVGGGNVLDDLGGVGLLVFRQGFQFFDGNLKSTLHARSIAQGVW